MHACPHHAGNASIAERRLRPVSLSRLLTLALSGFGATLRSFLRARPVRVANLTLSEEQPDQTDVTVQFRRPSPPRPWSTSRRSAPFDRRRRGGHVVDVPEHPLGSALLCAAAVRPTSTYAPVPSCRAPCAAGPGSRDRHRVVEAQVAIVRHRTHHGVVTGERVRSPSRPGARRACPARLMRTRAGCGGPRGGRALGSIERAATGCVQRKRLGSRVRPPPVEVR